MLKEHCTTTMHPNPLAALVEALLPIVFAPTPLRPRRRRVIKLLRRQGSIAVVAGRLRIMGLPTALATASSNPRLNRPPAYRLNAASKAAAVVACEAHR
jgi:hypothetical protein